MFFIKAFCFVFDPLAREAGRAFCEKNCALLANERNIGYGVD